jgi:hypothetical protein
MTTPTLAQAFELMAERPTRCSSLSARLVVSADDAGALVADLAERQRELAQSPEMIEQPPMRRRFGGRWDGRVFLHDGDVTMPPRQRPTTPAGRPRLSDHGPFELMLEPWRLLAGYQFDEKVEEAAVARRECWLLRGITRIAEPVSDHFVARWARASDSCGLAIDKELGIALSISAILDGRPWYAAELNDLGSEAPAKADASIDSDDDKVETVEAPDAALRLQFPLYLPNLVPRSSQLQIQVDASGSWAGVSLETSDFQWRVLVMERPAEAAIDEDLDEWERLEGNQWGTWIWDRSNDPKMPGQRWIVVRTERTHCSVYSTLPRMLLAEVAGSLKPLV